MLSIFLIGVALSMDAFSIALGIGLNKISKSERLLIPLIIGLMHFIMPLLGHFLGEQFFSIFNINPKFIVSLILFYLAIVMFLDRNNDNKQSITSIFSILILSFSVSVDSFSVGIGLSGLTNKYFLSFLVFSLCSSTITYIGLIFGNYSVRYLKDKAVYLGIIILLILSIVNICQVFIN